MAVRPHTLPAGASPVLVGSALAARDGVFAVGPALAALFGALFIQVATNLANDYYDAQKGVDTDNRKGFVRVTSAGLLAPGRVLKGALVAIATATLVGLYLVYVGGLPILAVGLAGLTCALLYAGGPVPLGSIGLGDVLVFVFFGLVAVAGTYYVQAVNVVDPGAFPFSPPEGTLPLTVLTVAVPVGALNTSILVVNNLRDLDTDRQAGKYTLAVLLGPFGTRLEYTLLLAAAYAVPLELYLRGPWSGWILLPVASLPEAVLRLRTVWQERGGDSLNDALSRTARLLLLYSLLLVVGILLSSHFTGGGVSLQ